MRWILVFILLYLIPLTVLFKNYKNFKRACIYGSIYIVLATTIVISNIYLSGIKIIEETLDYENDLVLETYLDYYESNYETEVKSSKNLDLQKIDEFKKDIYSIERVALIPMRDCLPYTNNLQKSLSNLTSIKSDVVYAMEMCKDVVKVYDEMEVPRLSKEEYIKVLDTARLNFKRAYELRTLAMENSIMLIDTKNPIYINKINQYLKLSDKEIHSFKENIENLKLNIDKK
ncbi:hypothetical protein [Terrisporobacter sp.]|uniref:hypothetical protein n=1 Tax=Terrisporobacter sp. TaxID=1965305 RepID=UPI00261C096E|nr:hypothetical protein [Terrisporobacter sp.]